MRANRRLVVVALLAVTSAHLMICTSGQFSSLTKAIAKDATKSGPVLPPASKPTSKPNSKRWQPKQTDDYAAQAEKVDWAGVVSACRAVVQFEKRLGNFWIRASFHDSMSVDVSACLAGGVAADVACGGTDASNMLSVEEMTRPENAYDKFTQIAAKASIKLAAYFNCSMADTVAVCAAVSAEVLSGDRIKIIGVDGVPNLRVGRLDRAKPTPPGLLPPANAPVADFSAFFKARYFTNEQAAALLGSHSLIDEQNCDMGPFEPACVPTAVGSCQNLRMFRWDNHYFEDICTPIIVISKHNPAIPEPDPKTMTKAQFTDFKNAERCKFTSEKFRKVSAAAADAARAGKAPVDPPPDYDVKWYRGCTTPDKPYQCPTARPWFYTVNDAFLGQVCQEVSSDYSDDAKELAAALQLFSQDVHAWDAVYGPTYRQMVSTFARWPSVSKQTMINGKECVSGWRADAKCASSMKIDAKTLTCTGCAIDGAGCHQCCLCGTVFKNGVSMKA